jgi:isopentenyldiphosphate isomerase
MSNEILDIVNKEGEIIGSASRKEIHAHHRLHRVVHLLVFNTQGRLLLQKRSLTKDVAPGKWDTSVGGHVDRGESIQEALTREMMEEISLPACGSEFLYSYIHDSDEEHELVFSFRCIYGGPIVFNRDEIDEVMFWDVGDIASNMHLDIFSENFKDEFSRYMDCCGR